MRNAPCILICAWLAGGSASAAPLVSGTVTARNGTPLADVQVQAEIRTVQTAAPSDAQGHFQFDAATLFTTGELRDAGGRLMLKFSKPGFQPINKQVRLAAGQGSSKVDVQLDSTGGSAAIAPAEKEALSKYVAAPGR